MLRKIIYNLRILTLICLAYLPHLAIAQNADSLIIVQAKWNTKTIKKGIKWNQGHFPDLFQSVQEINWIEIDLKRNRNKIHLAGDSSVLKTTSDFAEQNKAILAINGGFFDMKNGGAVDYLKINNQIINQTKTPSQRADAVFSIARHKISIDRATDEFLKNLQASNVMVSGPLLIEKDSLIKNKENPFNHNRHPRTAIAITNKNKLILMVVDGRNSQAQGMNLNELALVLKWIGARDAMNLDGGGSSTMFIKGMNQDHIVNHPSDNKKFDHQGQRAVANIIYVN